MLQRWNSSYVSPCLKQVETCAICLSCFEINRLKVTLCLFMLWTGWNLPCASSCFKGGTHPVSLHALNRLKVGLCLSCFEQAESWPVPLHVWGWNSPCVSSCLKQVETCAMSLVLWTGWKLACVSSCLEQAASHPIGLFMLWTGWNPTCASSCFKAEICHVSLPALNRLKLVVCLMLWTGWKLTCGSSCLRLKVTLCLFMLWTGWHLTCACPRFKAETHPMSLHALNRLKPVLYVSHALKLTGWKSPFVSSCFEQDKIWPVPPHASKLKLGLWLFML